jgi:hypothetical protein
MTYEHYNRYTKAKGFSVRLEDKEYITWTLRERKMFVLRK